MRRVTVAIPSWNGRPHLERCLAALRGQADPGVAWDVAVFDNGSSDGTGAWLAREHPAVRVHRSDDNLGFAAACNHLVERADADAVALLNNDTLPAQHWLAALVDALVGAPEDVVAVGGKVVDWEGQRLDFAGGILTFDGHAFQSDFGRPLSLASVPASGTDLLFATGSNMLVERDTFLRLGGFDADYFAYFEDVDFGWRAWSAGHRLIFAGDAIVRHRSSASGSRLGNARRGFLFERNAFMTAFKNYDAALWPRMMPAILMTLLSRMSASLLDTDVANHWLLRDSPGSRAPDAASKWVRGARRLLSISGRDRSLRLGVQAEAQLRAVTEVTRCIDLYSARREKVQAQRTIADRELFERFSLHVVPTYPGDAALFAGDAFATLLPSDIRFRRRELSEIMELP